MCIVYVCTVCATFVSCITCCVNNDVYVAMNCYRQHGFMSYKTSQYKLNLYETASGLKFVMNTDTSVPSIRDVLHHIYSSVCSFEWSHHTVAVYTRDIVLDLSTCLSVRSSHRLILYAII